MRFAFMFLVSIDRSEVPTPYGAVRLLLKFCFRVEFFDFHVSALLAYPVSGVWLLDFPQLLLYSSPVLGDHYGTHANVVLAGKF
jgi:hypothetical protein